MTGGRRFHRGVFLGIDRRTGQYMLYAEGELKLSRTIMRLPDNVLFKIFYVRLNVDHSISEFASWQSYLLSDIHYSPKLV